MDAVSSIEAVADVAWEELIQAVPERVKPWLKRRQWYDGNVAGGSTRFRPFDCFLSFEYAGSPGL